MSKTPIETKHNNLTKKCSYCGSIIDISASVCPVCKHTQSWLRNILLFLGSVAGLITLMASGILFSIDRAIQIYGTLYWYNELSVQYFHTYTNGHYDLILSNRGSGTVLVSEITIYYGNAFNYPFYIRKTVASGEFLTTPPLDVPSELRNFRGYANNYDGNPPKDILNKSSVDWKIDTDKCYGIFFVNSDAEGIRRMNLAFSADGHKLITSPVEAKIIYFDGRTGRRFDQSFSAVATYMVSSEPRCNSG